MKTLHVDMREKTFDKQKDIYSVIFEFQKVWSIFAKKTRAALDLCHTRLSIQAEQKSVGRAADERSLLTRQEIGEPMHYHTTRDKQLEYISKMSVELKKMAQNADEAFLSLLLDMAAMEARRCLSANEALTLPQPDHATPAHQ